MLLISGKAISAEQVMSNLSYDQSGSVVMHVAVVKPVSEGKNVAGIEFQIPMREAERELLDLTSEIRTKWEVDDIALCRRTGKLNFGDVILIAAVAAARHKPAFEACQFAVDQMKKMKSVIKKEIFSEPSEESKEVGPHQQLAVIS